MEVKMEAKGLSSRPTPLTVGRRYAPAEKAVHDTA
jgi:hypothetical protein